MDDFRALLPSRAERGALARLAEQSGISSNVLGRWRDGVGRPSPANLEKLAPALGVPYESLLRMCGYLPPVVDHSDLATVLARVQSENRELKKVIRDLVRQFSTFTGTRRQVDPPAYAPGITAA